MDFETFYQDLANQVAVIRALAAGVTLEQARHKPAPETWSILEVICHLYDEEREDFRQRLDIMLHQPGVHFPLIDPQGWVSARGYNQRDLVEMVEQWIGEREKSLAWLRGLKEPNWEVVYSDPFGSMTPGEMLACWVAHDNLHTRQLVELRRSRLVNLAAPHDVSYAGEW